MVPYLFMGFGALLVATALMVVLHRNPVTSALFLVLSFCSLAGIYLLLQAEFLGFVQIIVYAGAIMVLFLFVIMLLGAERLNQAAPQPGLRWQRPLAIGLGALLLIQAAYVFITRFNSTTVAPNLIQAGPMEIGLKLFGAYLLPFEVTSILLLVAIIGAVVLTREK